ncbi:transglycosylase SLT domain-containing protein [Desulfobacterales bacterium HSG17]|nr:transglycosylase SLT domain-containing protein [Desulfobacterales bacterium HSG17]
MTEYKDFIKAMSHYSLNKKRCIFVVFSVQKTKITAFILILLFTCGCTPGTPRFKNNICKIFKQNPDWYDHAVDSYNKWGIPIPIMMAIMYIESGFVADARPPRTTCFFIFPGPRPSSAYGYAQAIDSTWKDFQKQTKDSWADRDDFEDAISFIGWYCKLSRTRCGISKNDAFNLYLAYHEGHQGFNRGYYLKKAGVKKAARAVRNQVARYKKQFDSCKNDFAKPGGGCCLWPF